jgi:hypothetical protein
LSTPRPAGPLQLVFHGQCLEGHDPLAVRQAVALALKLDDARAARLFSGRRVVLRRGVDEATALRYVTRFRQLGAVLQSEPSPPAPAPAPAAPPLSWQLPRRTMEGAVAVLAMAVLAWGVGWPLVDAWQDWRALETRQAVVPVLDQPATPAQSPLPVAAAPAASAASAVFDDELPIDMGPAALREYRQQYLPAAGHKAFALGGQAYAWQAGSPSEDEAREAALTRCMRVHTGSLAACRIIDANGELTE